MAVRPYYSCLVRIIDLLNASLKVLTNLVAITNFNYFQSLTPSMGNDRDVFEVLKKKGAMPILYVAGAHGSVRFKDLEGHTAVSEPTIATRLDDLEETKLLERTFFDEMPPRVEYSLTPKSEALYDHLTDLFEWMAAHAETGQQATQGDDLEAGQKGSCVYCETGGDIPTDEDGEVLPWFQTVDGLIDRIGRTYAMGIVAQVDAEEPIRYSELKENLGISSDTALSTRLDDLEDADIMIRKSYDEVPPRVEYSLTDEGHELAEFIGPLLEWSEQVDG